jgi:xylulokinase
MEKDCFAVIDAGTTMVKAIIFDRHGNILGSKSIECKLSTPAPGFIEQNPDDIWRAVTETVKGAMKSSGATPAGLSISNQRATVMPLDESGNVLYPAITWMDTRVPPMSAEVNKKVSQRTSLIKILWLKETHPDIFRKTYKFATVDAFLYHRLAGVLGSDYSNAAYTLLDVKKLRWSDNLPDVCGVPVEKMVDLYLSGSIIGEITPGASSESGLPSGTPVIVGAGDQQCSSLGVGLTRKKIAKVTTGTGTFVDVCMDAPLFELYEPMTKMFTLPHALRGKWLLEALLPGTGALYRWFRDLLGMSEYSMLDEEASRIPPGSHGLILIPLFSFAHGAIQGLDFSHSRGHIARAIMESNGYGIRVFLELMSGLGIKVEELMVDGGGAKSGIWKQMQADITGLPVISTATVEHTSALGAAILAGCGTGVYRSVEEAVGAMVRVKERVEPIKVNREEYAKHYPKFREKFLKAASELRI